MVYKTPRQITSYCPSTQLFWGHRACLMNVPTTCSKTNQYCIAYLMLGTMTHRTRLVSTSSLGTKCDPLYNDPTPVGHQCNFRISLVNALTPQQTCSALLMPNSMPTSLVHTRYHGVPALIFCIQKTTIVHI